MGCQLVTALLVLAVIGAVSSKLPICRGRAPRCSITKLTRCLWNENCKPVYQCVSYRKAFAKDISQEKCSHKNKSSPPTAQSGSSIARTDAGSSKPGFERGPRSSGHGDAAASGSGNLSNTERPVLKIMPKKPSLPPVVEHHPTPAAVTKMPIQQVTMKHHNRSPGVDFLKIRPNYPVNSQPSDPKADWNGSGTESLKLKSGFRPKEADLDGSLFEGIFNKAIDFGEGVHG